MTDLLPDVRKKLRELTHAYLLRPDPMAWLVAADLLEEGGRGEESALWRARGEWFQDIMEVVNTALADEPTGPSWQSYRGPLYSVFVGPWFLRFRRTRHTVYSFVPRMGNSTGPPVPRTCPAYFASGHWTAESKQGDRFLHEKIVRLIDALHKNPL